jgi:phosphopantothenoylcysteine decarboxylase/phosphopantothenate--cysteine ligase
VRYISNHSSGKQGYALAQAAIDAGAEVTLISTVTHLPTPIGAELVAVNSAHEMRDAVLAHARCAVLIMAAAVADFRPAQVADQKIKKETAAATVILEKNEDILAQVGQNRPASGFPQVLIGFAAETENLLANAQSKLQRKNADMIVANDLTAPGAGFATETNLVTFITREAPAEALPLASKSQVAEIIIAKAAAWLQKYA